MPRNRLIACAAALCIGMACSLAAQSAAPLAVIDGEPLTEGELNIRGELLQLEQQAYEIRKKALEEAIGERLIAAEAKRRGVSKERLVKEEIESKIKEPTDLQIEAFYDRQKSRIGQPLPAVRPQIAEFLRRTSQEAARQSFVEKLRANSDVKVLLEPIRLPVDLSKAPMQGAGDAPVTIVEFSDFQCPFCKRIQPTLSELRDKYGDKIRWSFKDLPLVSIHPSARKAAEAARCAGEQGKFWEYRKALFDAGRISAELFPKTAAEIGLDGDSFETCLSSGKFGDAVDADAKEASDLGLNGTPAFLINGVVLAGAQPLEAFVEVIDRELERAAE